MILLHLLASRILASGTLVAALALAGLTGAYGEVATEAKVCTMFDAASCFGKREDVTRSAPGSMLSGAGMSKEDLCSSNPWVVQARAPDWNGDGRADLVTTTNGRQLKYWEFDPTTNAHVQKTGTENPFNGLLDDAAPSGGDEHVPTEGLEIADWDGDGNLDVLLGDPSNHTIRFFRRTGTPDGALIEVTGEQSPFFGMTLGPLAVAALGRRLQAVDWDGDKDLDLVVVECFMRSGTSFTASVIRYFERGGDGLLQELTGVDNPFASVILGTRETILVADWDMDGDQDVLVFTDNAELVYYNRNTAGQLTRRTGAGHPLGALRKISEHGWHSREVISWQVLFVDWDANGLPDLLFFDCQQSFLYSRSLDNIPIEMDSGFNSLEKFAGDAQKSKPQVVDFDGDGILDIISYGHAANFDSTTPADFSPLQFFKGSGGGAFSEVTNTSNIWPFKDFHWAVSSDDDDKVSLWAADWNNDTVMDMLVKDASNRVMFYQGLGQGGPLNTTGVHIATIGGGKGFQVEDWNGDGHLDILYGGGEWGPGRIYVLECNKGCPSTGSSLKEIAGTEIEAGTFHSVDWDGDGDLDILAVSGKNLEYYERTDPGLEKVTHNPFAGWSPFLDNIRDGLASVENLQVRAADLDGDGSLDLVAGTHENWYGGIFTMRQWKMGWCDPVSACSQAGICDPFLGRCLCLDGRSSEDCSTCQADFYSSPVAFVGEVSRCIRCPQDDKGNVCHERGICDDDLLARQERRDTGASSTAVVNTKGSGSCRCSEHFAGTDGSTYGRITCAEGACPAGQELGPSPSNAQKVRACQACGAGHGKDAKGNEACSQCDPGRFAPSGKGTCTDCPAGKTADSFGKADCEKCPAGMRPSDDAGTCVPCFAGTYSTPGDATCTACPAGFVSQAGGPCTSCRGGTFSGLGSSTCQECSFGKTSHTGSSECRLHEAALTTVILAAAALTVLLLACSWWRVRLRMHRKRQSRAEQQLHDAAWAKDVKKLDAAIEQATLLNVQKELLQKARGVLDVQKNKYLNFDALLETLEEGHLKLIRGSWLMSTNITRFTRMQDLPAEAFWTAADLRSQLRVISIVALSYCWLHAVNPDPHGIHLRVIQHALSLRINLTGPGRVQDVAMFIDFLSLPQQGEEGSVWNPEPGADRTQEERTSFNKGLAEVNVTYAHQQIEVWLLKWVPDTEKRKYMNRGWPFFEKAVSGLIKDATKLVELEGGRDSKIFQCCSWTEIHDKTQRQRTAPMSPEAFKMALEDKTFTSHVGLDRIEADRSFLSKKYAQTFDEVVPNTTTLWFQGVGWGDREIEQLEQVLPLCSSMQYLLVGDNDFSPESQLELVDRASKCEALQMMSLVGNMQVDNVVRSQMMSVWVSSGKDPKRLQLTDDNSTPVLVTRVLVKASASCPPPELPNVVDHSPGSDAFFSITPLQAEPSGA